MKLSKLLPTSHLSVEALLPADASCIKPKRTLNFLSTLVCPKTKTPTKI